MSDSYQYRSASTLANIVKVLLLIGAAATIVQFISGWMQLDLLGSAPFTEEQAESNDQREQLVATVSFAVLVITIIPFGMWIVRAQKNARALGAKGFTISPGWALGYFFVPIINLIRPYQAMCELWRGSHSPESGASGSPPALVGAWWGVWIIGGIVGQASARFSSRATDISDFEISTQISMASDVLGIGACALAFVLVSRITEAQESAHHGDAGFSHDEFEGE